MKVLILEDEKPAAEKLERLIKKYDDQIEVVGRLESVRKATDWFKEPGHAVDLIFMDIQLADGLSFDLFKQVAVQKPVIFTTAYNNYTMEAFKVSGIDYLLKPITYDALCGSMQKLDLLRRSLHGSTQPTLPRLDELSQALALLQKKAHKNRFMVRTGEHIHSVTTDQIALFYAVDRNVFLLTRQRKKYIIDYKLEDLEELLDPTLFFRVNRTFIVSINSISDVLVYSSSRLKISLNVEFDKEIIVSRERVLLFKDWFNGAG